MIEVFNTITDLFWELLMIFIGLIVVITGVSTFVREQRLIKTGTLVEATCIGSSMKKSIDSDTPYVKVPKFKFVLTNNGREKLYIIEGKINSRVEIGQKTPVYVNPKRPSKEYCMPKKDFLMKYLYIFIGSFFMCLGVLYVLQYINLFKDIYFLYLFIGLFIGTFLLCIIGKIIDN